jgi:8-oxo-dGTP pyrophosphatase MutT (NUDIX family)
MVVSLKTIQAALALPHFNEQQSKRARNIMMPTPILPERSINPNPSSRVGSVLILFYPTAAQTILVLTRRRDDMRTHPGQISFPGGGREGQETLAQTALRETEEEVGIPTDRIKIIGELIPTYVPPSDFIVHPFVGWYQSRTALNKRPIFHRNPAEVAEIVEIPVHRLLEESIRQEEPRFIKETRFLFPYFAVDQYKIWGATAYILSEVVERLRYVTKNGTG